MSFPPSLATLITQRKQRWLDFYDLNRPRQHRFMVHYLPGLGERPWPRPDNFPARAGVGLAEIPAPARAAELAGR